MQQKKIDLHFARINSSTDKMINIFRSVYDCMVRFVWLLALSAVAHCDCSLLHRIARSMSWTWAKMVSISCPQSSRASRCQ